MSQLSVTINGRQFRMACEDGQEGHLMDLARDLDERIDGLRKKFGEIGDTRLTVMAALTLADALSETDGRIKKLEEEVAALQAARANFTEHNKNTQVLTARLNQPTATFYPSTLTLFHKRDGIVDAHA